MSKIAFLFSGQGSQYVGMGKELYDKYPVFKQTIDSLNAPFDFQTLMFEGPEDQLNQTRYTQTCLVAMELALLKLLNHEGIHADVVAGLSLGEYTALVDAGVITGQEAIDIVVKRGALMDEACPPNTSGMAAVLGLSLETIQAICQSIDSSYGIVEVANDNCPNQIVIGGHLKALEQATLKLNEAGALKVIPLKVSGAFHTSLLHQAGKELREVLLQYSFNEPSKVVVTNTTGDILSGSVVDNLEKQIQSTVYFTQSIEKMIDLGVTTFIEVGPSKVLSGFVKKINRKLTILNVEDEASLLKVIGVIKEVKA